MIGKNKIIALCTSRVHDAACLDFIHELNDRIVKDDCRLFIYNTSSDLFWNTPVEDGEARVFDLIDHSVVDAVIIFSEKLKRNSVVDHIIGSAQKAGKPVLVLDGHYDGCINLNFDYEEGFRKVVRHVIEEHKVKKLHFIAGIKGNDFSESRLKVFKETLEEYGIPFDDSCVSYGDFWSVPAQQAVFRLADENRIPEAIVCANDVMAIAASAALEQRGFKVPRDVIVTGFDGIEEINFSVPKITSCLCSYKDMAETAAKLIKDFCSAEKIQRTYYIEPRFIASESCGCSPSSLISVSDYLNSVNDRFYRFQDEARSLSVLASKMQDCGTAEELSALLDNKEILYDMTCILKDEVLDESCQPREIHSETAFGEKLHVVLDFDNSKRGMIVQIDIKQLFPDIEHTVESRKCPVVFNALSFLDIPLGYVCFFYNDFTPDNYIKISQIVSYLNSGISGFRNMRYQKYLGKQIENIYKYDSLTGLYNRLGFTKDFPAFKEKYRGKIITAVLADLDGLKHINDTYGHDEGDIAIKALASALKSSCPEGSICIRFGGDEMFAVIGEECDPARIKADMYAFIERFNEASDKPYEVSASVGIYTSDDGTIDFEELVRKSDELMYIDKFRKKGIDFQ